MTQQPLSQERSAGAHRVRKAVAVGDRSASVLGHARPDYAAAASLSVSQARRAQELADEMNWPATLSGLADRLERQDRSRSQCPEDRRVVQVSLTPEGRRVLSEIRSRRMPTWRPCSIMGQERVEDFVSVLESFRAADERA
jgi:DNA-binding MarR family transcriptional regulator